VSRETAILAKPAVTELTTTAKGAVASGAAAATPGGSSLSNDAIRLNAYLKWEAAGKPGGDGVDFWLQAERELRQLLSKAPAAGEGPVTSETARRAAVAPVRRPRRA
jgi:hypothetical protein